MPFNYPPLYYWAGGALVHVFGDSFAPLRALSFAASIACGALLYLLVHGMTGRRAAGVLAAGLFFATYRLAGAWFDLARTDSLHLALVLGCRGVVDLRERVVGLSGRGAKLAVDLVRDVKARLRIDVGIRVGEVIRRARDSIRPFGHAGR